MLRHLQPHEWQAFVDGHPGGTIFHHQNWLRLLSEQYHFRLHTPAIKNNGSVVASLPLLESRGLFGERKLISLPFTDCVRVLSSGNEPTSDLFQAITQEYSEHRSIVVKTDRPTKVNGAESNWVRHELDDLGSRESLAEDLSGSTRRNLARARRNRLTFARRTDPDGMESFYDLHLVTRRRLGVPIQPKSFFRRLYEMIVRPGLGFVGVVSKDSIPIAAAVFLTFNGTMVYKYGASSPDALGMRPNDFLFFHAIRLAIDEGMTRLDFGVSERHQTGLRRFKSKWGAAESDVYHEYLIGSRRSAGNSAVLKIASFVIRNSPPSVCRAVGEVFYRYSQ